MDTSPLSAHYDAEMDIFSAWSRQPEEVVCVEPSEGIVLRMDPITNELVGYTILDLRKQFERVDPDTASLPFVSESQIAPLRAQLKLLCQTLTPAA
jgi:hypothetical protein